MRGPFAINWRKARKVFRGENSIKGNPKARDIIDIQYFPYYVS